MSDVEIIVNLILNSLNYCLFKENNLTRKLIGGYSIQEF